MRRLALELLEDNRAVGLVWDDVQKRAYDFPQQEPWRQTPLAEEKTPPLTSALRVFLDAIEGKPDPRLGFDLGLTVVRRLEGLERAATRPR